MFARVLVLKGDMTLVVVALDLIGLDVSNSDLIRSAVGGKLGVPAVNVMVNCSHTHSAPYTIAWGLDWRECWTSEWFKALPGRIAACAVQAAAAPREAVLRHGREQVRVGFNRRLPTADGMVMRDNPEGSCAPWTDVVSFHSPVDGRLLGVMFSAAAHPVVIHASSTLISADYPGFAVKAVEGKTDGAFALFVQGCCGDVNAKHWKGGFDKARELGESLAAAALSAVRAGEPVHPAFASAVCRFLLPYQSKPSSETIATAAIKFKGEGVWAWAAPSVIEEFHGMRDLGKEHPLVFEIQAFRLAEDLCLVGMTHEALSEYQLWLDGVSPFKHTMALGYTNGCGSYIPLEKHFAEGGYESGQLPEVGSSLFYHPRLRLQAGLEATLKGNLTSILNEIKATESKR